ncbi:MAG: STAS domain-containing protein [Candidatus Merdivicinus sp.]|jgi:stage II sporulation protein AA (anti-sigma F factor antagonist)
MPVTYDSQEDKLFAHISGDIDHHSAAGLRDSIDRMVESALPQLLVLDFSGVSFMDSSGIGLIMGRYKLMQSLGGSIRVERVPAPLKRLMNLAGLSLLPITIS